MKLILERFRQFENKTLLEQARYPRGEGPESWEEATSTARAAEPSMFKQYPNAWDRKAYDEIFGKNGNTVREILSLVDVTGILSWPGLRPAYDHMLAKPSKGSVIEFLLAVVSVIPIVTVAAKSLKAAKLLQKLIRLASKILPASQNLADAHSAVGLAMKAFEGGDEESPSPAWDYKPFEGFTDAEKKAAAAECKSRGTSLSHIDISTREPYCYKAGEGEQKAAREKQRMLRRARSERRPASAPEGPTGVPYVEE